MAKCRTPLTNDNRSMRIVVSSSPPIHSAILHVTSPSLNISLVCTVLIVMFCVRNENHVDAVQGCSVFFQPDFKWKKAICDSETSRLDRIPSDLPSNLVELHVTHQFITVLGAEGLRELVHLQTLAIESSGLRRVTLDAFHSLANLTQLNLRNNSLQLGYNGLPAEVVRRLPRLRMLNLAENPVNIVPDLFFVIPGSGVPSPLHRLWLGSTKSVAMHVERQAFVGLRYLRLLDLSDAKLTTLPVSVAGHLDLMLDLKELYLGGNPWHCDCQLRWLRTWFVGRQARNKLVYLQQRMNRYGRQVVSEPTCFSPEPLRDRKLFGSDTVGTVDFSETNCAPTLLTVHQNVTLMVNKVNKLTCEFYADPKASVSWFQDGMPIKNDSRFSVVNYFLEETLVSNLYARFTQVGKTETISCSLAMVIFTVIASSADQPLPKSIIDTSGNLDTITSTIPSVSTAQSNLTPLGGSLIRETVSTGENRLLVSCDGPEPTVLLATRFSTYNELSSPSSVYGVFGTNKLSPTIKVTLPGSVGNYICSPSFPGQNPTDGLPDKTHIYASPAPVTNLYGLQKTPQLISLPKAHYSTPCPVHGSIQLNRVEFSQTQSSAATNESLISIDTNQNAGGTAGLFRLNTITSTHSTVTNSSPPKSTVLASKSNSFGTKSCSDLSGKSRLSALPEYWYQPALNRTQFRTSVADHEGTEDNPEDEEVDDEDEEDVEGMEEDEEEEEEEEEEDLEEDDDDDSDLLPHSRIVIPTVKPDISFRSAAHFADPRRFKSRGGTTLHRPKSFTVLNSRMIGSKPSLIIPQSGSVHRMHSDTRCAGRGYPYSSNEKILSSSGLNTPPTRHTVGLKLRSVSRITPQRATMARQLPLPSGGPPCKAYMRTSFNDDLDRIPTSSAVHETTGSNPDTSEETWNSNSESETPTEETSSLTQAIEVMSNTERSAYEENEFISFPRQAAVRHRGSSSTLNFPPTRRSKYPTTGGYPCAPATSKSGRIRSENAGVYRVATLPSRFRQSRSPGGVSSSAILSGPMIRTAVPGGSYRDFVTLQRRASAQRSQTLIRPGSKHKLDTDSGTDNND
ncbi:hypothetical protein FGIG_03607 [Fasciola gigantica]|uniref:Ig-like domain-containing protein n=1 Tax=Fasciola gigantica TaxID=46835 RepID=A0A504Y919_FASGI|nr:hypothetical protein FGIG_03607 [Fasciola gigantica]